MREKQNPIATWHAVYTTDIQIGKSVTECQLLAQ